MIELILSNTNHVALSDYLFNLIQILLKGKTVLVGYYICVSMCELPSCRVGTYHSGQQGQLTSRLKDIRHVCVQPGCMIVYTVHHEVWSTDQSYNKKNTRHYRFIGEIDDVQPGMRNNFFNVPESNVAPRVCRKHVSLMYYGGRERQQLDKPTSAPDPGLSAWMLFTMCLLTFRHRKQDFIYKSVL